eukprot:TRINITY_DN3499_c3_g2_i1.p1 TRINITY_DN3499_c3_g2~~TRINITY_DN3499_c3_g2_i1.p1  ORF type:complete len:831 (+),score=267.48 TRINITY_DN3499_c3_g2_i1:80-2572(+)
MPSESVQLNLFIKSAAGQCLHDEHRRHPRRQYALKWKRGSRPENKGRTCFAPVTGSVVQWGQRCSLSMTCVRKGSGYERKLVKLSIERDGQVGAFSSATVGECVIDAAQYVGLEGAQEFAFPILLGNRQGSEVKVHIVFTSHMLGAAPTAAASGDGESSCALSELASTRGGSSVRSDTEASDDGGGPVESPRTLLRKLDEQQQRRRQRRAERPERAFTAVPCSVRVVARKAHGAGLGDAAADNPRARFRLRWRLAEPPAGRDGERGAETQPAGLIRGTVRWEHPGEVPVTFVHPTGKPDALARRRVELVLESAGPGARTEELGTCAFDLARYARPDGGLQTQDYAFPMRLAAGGEAKVQLGFRVTPDGQPYPSDADGAPVGARPPAAAAAPPRAPPAQAPVELRVRLRVQAGGQMQQTVRSLPAAMPLRMLAQGLAGLEGYPRPGGDLTFRRGRDTWTAERDGSRSLADLGICDGDVVSINIAAEDRPPPVSRRRQPPDGAGAQRAAVQPRGSDCGASSCGDSVVSTPPRSERSSGQPPAGPTPPSAAELESLRRQLQDARGEAAGERRRRVEAEQAAAELSAVRGQLAAAQQQLDEERRLRQAEGELRKEAAAARERADEAASELGLLRQRLREADTDRRRLLDEAARLSGAVESERRRAAEERDTLQGEMRSLRSELRAERRRAAEAERRSAAAAAEAAAAAALRERSASHPAAAPRRHRRGGGGGSDSGSDYEAVAGERVGPAPGGAPVRPEWIDDAGDPDYRSAARPAAGGHSAARRRSRSPSSGSSSGGWRGGRAVWADEAAFDTDSGSSSASPRQADPRRRGRR